MQKAKDSKVKGSFLLKAAVFCLAAVALVSLVERQIRIAEKQAQLAQLEAQLEEQTAKNEDLQAALDNGEGVREYAERRARSLGYARPNERVYVDVGGGE